MYAVLGSAWLGLCYQFGLNNHSASKQSIKIYEMFPNVVATPSSLSVHSCEASNLCTVAVEFGYIHSNNSIQKQHINLFMYRLLV